MFCEKFRDWKGIGGKRSSPKRNGKVVKTFPKKGIVRFLLW